MIAGVAVGMKSTVVPSITVSIAVVAAYHLGRTSGRYTTLFTHHHLSLLSGGPSSTSTTS